MLPPAPPKVGTKLHYGGGVHRASSVSGVARSSCARDRAFHPEPAFTRLSPRRWLGRSQYTLIQHRTGEWFLPKQHRPHLDLVVTPLRNILIDSNQFFPGYVKNELNVYKAHSFPKGVFTK